MFLALKFLGVFFFFGGGGGGEGEGAGPRTPQEMLAFGT